jgi:hypothetical protein
LIFNVSNRESSSATRGRWGAMISFLCSSTRLGGIWTVELADACRWKQALRSFKSCKWSLKLFNHFNHLQYSNYFNHFYFVRYCVHHIHHVDHIKKDDISTPLLITSTPLRLLQHLNPYLSTQAGWSTLIEGFAFWVLELYFDCYRSNSISHHLQTHWHHFQSLFRSFFLPQYSGWFCRSLLSMRAHSIFMHIRYLSSR